MQSLHFSFITSLLFLLFAFFSFIYKYYGFSMFRVGNLHLAPKC
jgi:hypothetical protein